MQNPPPAIRLTESFSGRLAAWLLVVIACASMAMSTSLVYSHIPALVGIALVVLLTLWGLLRSFRVPRITLLSWISLAIGGYFYWRASTSYSQLEGANVMALVLGAAVFYGAGIYSGLAKRADTMMAGVVAFALILNAVYWYLARHCDLSLMWWGRPDVGLLGPNSQHTAFFLYKNVAAVFFAAGGIYLIARLFWLASWTWVRAFGALLGLLSIGLTCQCGSRTIYAIIPLLLFLAYFLGIFLRIKSGKRMRWFDWCAILATVAALATVIFDMAGEQHIWLWIDGINTHLRSYIWRLLMQIVPQASWLGFGAGASQWEIVTVFGDWCSPNYAHNEYLQAWVDFGLLGLLGVLLIVFGHLARAIVSLSDASLPHERRVQVAAALLLLVAVSAYAFVDFPWHNFAMVAFTAFLCGILAAPRGEELRLRQYFASENSRIAQERPATRLQQGLGRLLLIAVLLGILEGTGCLIKRFAPAWQADWEYSILVAQGASIEEQKQFLQKASALYPDFNLVTWYRQYPWERTQEGYQTLADMLEPCVQANPKQLFGVAKYSEALSFLGRYEEAESILRESYPPDGPNRQNLYSWHTYYGMNLLRWARHLYSKGQFAQAYSLYQYAYRIDAKSALVYQIGWRVNNRLDINNSRGVEGSMRRTRAPYMKKILERMQFMQRVGVKPDNTWKQAMRPDGPTALYKRWGEIPAKWEKK